MSKNYQMNATISTVEKVQISGIAILDIVEKELKAELAAFRNLLINDSPHYNIKNAEYINREGLWESWENGHGSGYTTIFRAATVEEKDLNDAINKALNILRKRLRDGN